MTVNLMAGFDTVVGDTDLRSQGWAASTNTGWSRCAGMRSSTSAQGRSLRLTGGTGYAPASTAMGGGGADPGLFNTGLTINQLWSAGGCTLGARAKFNEPQGSAWSDGAINPGAAGTAFAVDGTNLYAVILIGGVRGLYKSTDGGLTWPTLIPAPPAPFSGYNAQTVISTPSPGLLWVGTVGFADANTNGHWSTTDGGTTWTQGSAFAANSAGPVRVLATGNSAYPYAFLVRASATIVGGIYVSTGSISGALVKVVNIGGTNTAVTEMRVIGDFILGCIGLDTLLPVRISTLPTVGAGIALSGGTLTGTTLINDIAQVGTNWVVSTSNGLHYQAVVGTNAPAAAGWTAATGGLATGATNALYKDANNVLYATVAGSSITYSSDGITWAGVARNIAPYYSTTGLINTYADTAQGGGMWMVHATGILARAVQPQLLDSYEMRMYPDQAESASNGNSGLGVYAAVAGTFAASAGTFTLAASDTSSRGYIGLTASAVTGSANAYTRSVVLGNNTGTLFSASQPVAQPGDTIPLNPWHYYELVLVKDPAVVNSFFVGLKIDGAYAIPLSGVSASVAAAADTTSLAIVCLPRSGNWTGFDDLFLTTGTEAVSAIGPQQIIPRFPTSDVQAQWTRNGVQATNAASVNKAAISQTANTDYVESSLVGNKDIYGMSYASGPAIAASRKIAAVQVEAYTARNGSAVPSIVLGKVSSSVVAEGPDVVVASNTPMYMAQIFEQNPNGSVAWTPATVAASTTSVKQSA